MSLFSTGSINGNVINTEIVDGGHFVLGASASAGVAVGSVLRAGRRAVARAVAGIAIPSVLSGRRRLVGGAAAGAVLGCTAAAARRTVGAGAAVVTPTAAALGVARRPGCGAADVTIQAALHIQYWKLRRAPPSRTWDLPFEDREFRVPADPPTEPVKRPIEAHVPRRSRGS